MAKVTSKLQLTLPRAIAVQYGIEPGTQVEFVPAGDLVLLVPGKRPRRSTDTAARLRRFDAATARIRARPATAANGETAQRGWSRDELNDRASGR